MTTNFGNTLSPIKVAAAPTLVINSNVTLTSYAYGRSYKVTGAYTVTLPSTSSGNSGLDISFMNDSTYPVIFNCQGSDYIRVMGVSVASITLVSGDSVIFQNTGTAFGLADSNVIKAPINSPALTGIPTAPTAAVNNNTTQLATTAYVLGQASGLTPIADSTIGSPGASSTFARGDHVHPPSTAFSGPTGASNIGYTPPFTGATATTVAAELARRINIWDFADANALGLVRSDGLSDWTTAIQAAVNYVQKMGATGGYFTSTHPTTLYFPGGLYYVFGTVVISGAMSFEGDGGPASYTGTNLQSAFDPLNTTVPAGHAIFTFSSNWSVSLYFSKMSFNGAGSGGSTYQPGTSLITNSDTSGSSNSIYFRDCWFKTTGNVEYAVSFVSPTDDVQFHNCTFDSTKHSALNFGSTAYWHGVSIVGTAGQFTCSPSFTILVPGSPITISGTLGGTGSISGYVSGTTYYVGSSTTPTSTTFQLVTRQLNSDGSFALDTNNNPIEHAVTTTPGTPTGLTYYYDCNILNLSIIGCDFYCDSPTGESFIELYFVKDTIIANNRFWVTAPDVMLYAIKYTSAKSARVTITGNTCEGCGTFVNIAGSYNIISNNAVACKSTAISIMGGADFGYNTIIGNNIYGAPSSGNGVIDGTGVNIISTVIQGNVIQGNGLGPALKVLPSTYTTGGNSIHGNAASPFANDGANGYFSFTPQLGFSGGGGTFHYATTPTGNYVIANGFVTLDFVITLDPVTPGTAGSGDVIITSLTGGLPIAVGPVDARGSVNTDKVLFPLSPLVTGPQTTQTTLVGKANSSILNVEFSGNGATRVNLQLANIPLGSTISGSITYAYAGS